MTRALVFHLPKKFLTDYSQRPHLAIFAIIEDIATAHGISVRVVARDDQLTLPGIAALPTDAVHIVADGQTDAPHVINTPISYMPPFWHVARGGILFDSAARDAVFVPGARAKAAKFGDRLRRRLVENRRSRYAQEREVTAIAPGVIAVFLQGDAPERQGSGHISTPEMIRAVCAAAQGRAVVIKPHPMARAVRDARMLAQLAEEGCVFTVTTANIHDILARAAATVSMNSAVALEGYLHAVPAVLCGRADFNHIAETAQTGDSVGPAIEAAIARPDRPYDAYLQWYFTTQTVNLNDGAQKRILPILRAAGLAV